jgi:5-formyltetrahydrofolate cyclo-ligase
MESSLLKQALRKEFISRRDSLPLEEKKQREANALTHFLPVLPSAPCTIHLYLSAQGKSEFDTWGLSEMLFDKGYQLCIPYITHRGNMLSVNYNSKADLVQKKFGLFEPELPEFTNPASIRIIIVPMLAFDNECYRLGYGGGYYDTYLKDFKDIPKVGLSLFDAESSILPRDPWDIPLDAVASPFNLHKTAVNRLI